MTDDEFVSSSQGSENAGKILSVNDSGIVEPVQTSVDTTNQGLKGKILSIMGDSITTFAGWTPVADGHNLAHRNRYPQSNLFTDVQYCWWYKLFNDLGMKLGINDSWAGSRVNNALDNNSGDQGPDAAMASLTRITNLGSNGTPDIILYYGGTNDCGHQDSTWPLGTFDSTQNYHTVDLTSKKWESFADAYKCSIMRMQYFYPDAKIIVMLPTYCTSYYTMGNLDKYNEVIKDICDYFGVPVIDLRECGINWQNKGWTLGDGIHPTAAGADLIFRYVKQKLLSMYNLEAGERTIYTVTHNLTNVSGEKFWYRGTRGGEAYTESLTSAGTINATIVMDDVDITASAWDSSTNEINIANVTGDISITASSTETSYGITTTVTNGTFTGDTNIQIDGTATVTITPDQNYILPVVITVTGATYSYDYTTGVISLSNPTGSVTIDATCVTAGTITWYTNEPTSGTTSVNTAGYGWAPYICRDIVGYPVNTVSFVSTLTSGSLEIGRAIYNATAATDVQTIAWDSSNKVGNVVTVDLPSTVTLSTNEYFVVYPETQPEANAFCYNSGTSGSGFYTDTPISRRGNNPWRASGGSSSLLFNFGYKAS